MAVTHDSMEAQANTNQNQAFVSLLNFLLKEKSNHAISRLGTLFFTENNNYYYDTGTGKVVLLEDSLFVALKKLFYDNYSIDEVHSSFSQLEPQIKDAFLQTVRHEHLFQRPHIEKMYTEDMLYISQNRLTQIILELTEKCNFRCKYCIFSEGYSLNRSFGTNNMSWDVAKRAIDFALKHSQNTVAITFYGGEPLANFPLLKRCILYAQENANGKTLLFNFTTNLTLVTEDIASFLASVPHLSILASLDGPEDIHNSKRVYANGTDTFRDAMRGLSMLSRAFEGTQNTISTNTVLTPPYDFEKLDRLNNFFSNLKEISSTARCMISYTAADTFPPAKNYTMQFVRGNPKYDWNGINDALLTWEAHKVKKDGLDVNNTKALYYSGLSMMLTRIHRRMISDTPTNLNILNGNCIPGQRRLFVTTRGEFKLCERIEDSPSIGNVYEGYDADSIRKHFIVDYATLSLPECDHCWAFNLCSVCYAGHYTKNGLNLSSKLRDCSSCRAVTQYALSLYHELMEEDEHKLDFLNHIVVG